MEDTRPSVASVQIGRVNGPEATATPDLLVIEEPLEMQLGHGPADERRSESVSVTMRTPGHDFELVAGFFYAEALLDDWTQVEKIAYCTAVERPEELGNVVKMALKPGRHASLDRLQRHFYASSSCGVCGKASIEALELVGCAVFPQDDGPKWSAEAIHALPETARAAQTVFKHTGGIHAATLFDASGRVLCTREDVGRHNTVDKVVGTMLMAGKVPMSEHLMLVSGRAGFELVQKAVRAGIRIMASVGAPSSLAVDLAREYNMTLLGFVRNERFNIYSGAQRILLK
ncbi:MAG: formate dehydrogenase accessory sulfurtransferase FdhD [Bacteroidota bacterium]